MSLLIAFSSYEILLRLEDENTVKAAFQKLFEMLSKGYTIPRSKKEVFKALVKEQISSSSAKVRKWAYHCACFCSPPIDDLCKKIITELQKENEIENILWGLSALSLKYGNEELLRQCVGKRHDEFLSKISKNYLFDALALFGSVENYNIYKILDTNNTADLVTLTKIYGYPYLVLDKFPEVTQDVIRSFESHNDPYLREFAFWAQALTGSKGNFTVLSDDPDENVQKHLVTLQIKNGDEDFISSVLKTTSMRVDRVSLSIKTGIMRGLYDLKYNSKYVPYVSSWFAKETSESIVIMLLDYIISNCRFNREEGTYFDVIQDSLGDLILLPYITKKIEQNKEYDLVLKTIGNKVQLDFISKGEVVMKTYNVSMTGSGNSLNFADDHSSASTTIGGNNDQSCSSASTTIGGNNDQSQIDELIQGVRTAAKAELSEELLAKVNERLDDILEIARQKQPKKSILNGLLDGLKVLSGSVTFVAAVTKLIDYFNK